MVSPVIVPAAHGDALWIWRDSAASVVQGIGSLRDIMSAPVASRSRGDFQRISKPSSY